MNEATLLFCHVSLLLSDECLVETVCRRVMNVLCWMSVWLCCDVTVSVLWCTAELTVNLRATWRVYNNQTIHSQWQLLSVLLRKVMLMMMSVMMRMWSRQVTTWHRMMTELPVTMWKMMMWQCSNKNKNNSKQETKMMSCRWLHMIPLHHLVAVVPLHHLVVLVPPHRLVALVPLHLLVALIPPHLLVALVQLHHLVALVPLCLLVAVVPVHHLVALVPPHLLVALVSLPHLVAVITVYNSLCVFSALMLRVVGSHTNKVTNYTWQKVAKSAVVCEIMIYLCYRLCAAWHLWLGSVCRGHHATFHPYWTLQTATAEGATVYISQPDGSVQICYTNL